MALYNIASNILERVAKLLSRCETAEYE
jgi:hypothetical protein